MIPSVCQNGTLADKMGLNQWFTDVEDDYMRSLLGFDGGLPAMIWGGILGGMVGVSVWNSVAQLLLGDGFESNRFALWGLAATVNFIIGTITFLKFSDFSREEWQNALLVHFFTGAINASLGLMVYMKFGGIYDTLSTVSLIYYQSLLFFFSILLLIALLDKTLSLEIRPTIKQNLLLLAFGWPFLLIGALWAIPITCVRYLMLNMAQIERT